MLRPRITPAPARARAGSTASGATGRGRCAQGYLIANVLAGLERQDAGRPGLRRRLRAVAGREVPDRHRRRLDPAQGAVLPRRGAGRGRARHRARPAPAMAARPAWTGYRFVALRTGARLLPHGADSASAQKVRNMAAALNDRDAGFEKLRVKIHNTPRGFRCRSGAGVGRTPRIPSWPSRQTRWRPRSIASMRRARSAGAGRHGQGIGRRAGAQAGAAGGARRASPRPAAPSSA